MRVDFRVTCFARPPRLTPVSPASGRRVERKSSPGPLRRGLVRCEGVWINSLVTTLDVGIKISTPLKWKPSQCHNPVILLKVPRTLIFKILKLDRGRKLGSTREVLDDITEGWDAPLFTPRPPCSAPDHYMRYTNIQSRPLVSLVGSTKVIRSTLQWPPAVILTSTSLRNFPSRES